MTECGTWLKEDGDRAEVITKPKKKARTSRYPFAKVGNAWMLARERDWYSDHALTYASGRLDGPPLRKQMHPNQATFDDFDQDGPSDRGRVGVTSSVTAD